MAVTEQTPLNSYAANGATTVFAFSFLLLQAADLVVQVIDITGITTTKSLGVDYTVAGLNVAAGGTVTFVSAPSNGSRVVIFRDSDIARSTDYQHNGDLLADTVNQDFDRLWLVLQEIFNGGKGAPTALRVPNGETVPALPKAADRASRLIGFDSNGNPIAVIPTAGDASALALDLASSNTAAKGSGQIGFSPALNYAAQTIGATLIDRGVDLMSFVTSQAERAAIKAGTSTLDHAPLFASALALSKRVFVPAGSWRLLSTVTLPTSSTIEGAGVGATAVTAYGCDAFTVAAGGSLVRVAAMGLFSRAAGGAADPRLYAAIYCNGASGNTVNYVTCRDLYLQGWADGINWRYAWNSRIDNVTTINTNNGVTIVGQSVNNSITGSRLIANGGNASINSSQISSDTPEGLMVGDTLLSSGLYGVLAAGSFLSLTLANCVLDLISGDAVRATDCKDLRIVNSWLYAANCCVRLMALGSNAVEGVSLVGNGMRITSAAGRVIEQNGANIGMSVVGNRLTFGGTSVGVYLDGQGATVDSNHFDNSGSGADVGINSSASTHRIGKNTKTSGVAITVAGGFATPEYAEGNWTVTDQSGAALAITTNAQATYVKVGKMVTVVLDIRYPVTADANTARLALPFQPDAGAAPAGSIGFQDIAGTFMPTASTAAANFIFWKPGASGAYATNANLSGARLQISFTYRANN